MSAGPRKFDPIRSPPPSLDTARGPELRCAVKIVNQLPRSGGPGIPLLRCRQEGFQNLAGRHPAVDLPGPREPLPDLLEIRRDPRHGDLALEKRLHDLDGIAIAL